MVVLLGGTTGFVVMLAVGPLILAPLSETFGARFVAIDCVECAWLMVDRTAQALSDLLLYLYADADSDGIESGRGSFHSLPHAWRVLWK